MDEELERLRLSLARMAITLREAKEDMLLVDRKEVTIPQALIYFGSACDEMEEEIAGLKNTLRHIAVLNQ